MSRMQRIKHVLAGFFLFVCGLIMLIEAEVGFMLISFILGAGFVLSGLRSLVFYFSMAKHMVGGQTFIIRGVIAIDIGITFLTVSMDGTLLLVIAYVMVCHAIAGVIDILRALESKRMGAAAWKMNCSYGVVNLIMALMAIICGFFLQSVEIVVWLYSCQLLYSSVVRIGSAFRKTAIVFIQ